MFENTMRQGQRKDQKGNEINEKKTCHGFLILFINELLNLRFVELVWLEKSCRESLEIMCYIYIHKSYLISL